jgi:hypothetical protein
MYDSVIRDIETQRELLSGYLTHVPPAVNSGSYNTSVEFKKAVVEGRRVHGKRNVTLGELNSAINNLHRYWS